MGKHKHGHNKHKEVEDEAQPLKGEEHEQQQQQQQQPDDDGHGGKNPSVFDDRDEELRKRRKRQEMRECCLLCYGILCGMETLGCSFLPWCYERAHRQKAVSAEDRRDAFCAFGALCCCCTGCASWIPFCLTEVGDSRMGVKQAGVLEDEDDDDSIDSRAASSAVGTAAGRLEGDDEEGSD